METSKERFLLLRGNMARGAFWGAMAGLFIVNLFLLRSLLGGFLFVNLLNLLYMWIMVCVFAARLRNAGKPLWLAFGIVPLSLGNLTLPGLAPLFGLVMLAAIVVVGVLSPAVGLGQDDQHSNP